MEQIAALYAPWGGNAEAMASDIGENPITVRQWRNRGSIPPRYWRKIISAADRKGCALTFDSFVPPATDTRPVEQKEAA